LEEVVKILSSLILVLSMTVSIGCSHFKYVDYSQSQEDIETSGDVVSFENDDGEKVKIDYSHSSLLSEENKIQYLRLGASIANQRYLCSQRDLKKSSQQLKKVETELELKNIIDSLEQTQRKSLSQTQKDIIYNTPICAPFVDELKTISMQLKGYKVIRK
jgi:hypothetical protein